jgi:hypothetical protein
VSVCVIGWPAVASAVKNICVADTMLLTLQVNLPLTAVGRSACMQLLQALLPLVVGWDEASSLPGSSMKQLQSQAPGAQAAASSTAAGVAPEQQAAGSSPPAKQQPAEEQAPAGTGAAAGAPAGSTAAAQASSRPGELAVARATAEEHASEPGEARWSIAAEEQRWDMPTGVSITGWDSLHLGDVTKLLAVLGGWQHACVRWTAAVHAT